MIDEDRFKQAKMCIQVDKSIGKLLSVELSQPRKLNHRDLKSHSAGDQSTETTKSTSSMNIMQKRNWSNQVQQTMNTVENSSNNTTRPNMTLFRPVAERKPIVERRRKFIRESRNKAQPTMVDKAIVTSTVADTKEAVPNSNKVETVKPLAPALVGSRKLAEYEKSLIVIKSKDEEIMRMVNSTIKDRLERLSKSKKTGHQNHGLSRSPAVMTSKYGKKDFDGEDEGKIMERLQRDAKRPSKHSNDLSQNMLLLNLHNIMDEMITAENQMVQKKSKSVKKGDNKSALQVLNRRPTGPDVIQARTESSNVAVESKQSETYKSGDGLNVTKSGPDMNSGVYSDFLSQCCAPQLENPEFNSFLGEIIDELIRAEFKESTKIDHDNNLYPTLH